MEGLYDILGNYQRHLENGHITKGAIDYYMSIFTADKTSSPETPYNYEEETLVHPEGISEANKNQPIKNHKIKMHKKKKIQSLEDINNII